MSYASPGPGCFHAMPIDEPLTHHIRDLPIYHDERLFRGHGFPEIPIKEYKIIVWISLTERYLTREEFPLGTPRIPALLDTGCQRSLSLPEEYLVRSGFVPRENDWGGKAISHGIGGMIEGQELFADVWLHSSASDMMDTGLPPHKIHTGGAQGVALFPAKKREDAGGPGGVYRLGRKSPPEHDLPHPPLLGLRALSLGGIKLEIRGLGAAAGYPMKGVAGLVELYVPRS